MTTINIQFTLFSAFYSPLISSISGGFLKAEGLEPNWSISPPGVSAIAALEVGSIVQAMPGIVDVTETQISECSAVRLQLIRHDPDWLNA